jgi:hypothetical protein
MAHKRLFARPFELHTQIAQKSSVPQVAVAFKQAICLLEGEEIDNKATQGG